MLGVLAGELWIGLSAHGGFIQKHKTVTGPITQQESKHWFTIPLEINILLK